MANNPAWHEAYPQPRNQFPTILERKELLDRLQKGEKPGVDFLLVDLRRIDHEGGTIKGSLNLPAQTLYHSLPTVLNICKSANIKAVIWYCGSSRGRGTRAAGWFDDLLQDHKIEHIRSVILLGGIKGWAAAGDEYTDLMDGYDAAHWVGKSD